jgi:hypothetical protein
MLNFIRFERLHICGVAAERQRVDWILRLFLMEDIRPIFPIWEPLLVMTCSLCRCIIKDNLGLFKWSPLAFLPTEVVMRGSFKLHLVRVDYLGLFLEVECSLVILGESTLLVELLLVMGDGHRRVRIPHKPVNTTSLLPIQVVTCRHLIN